MYLKKFVFIAIFPFLFSIVCSAQTRKTVEAVPKSNIQAIKNSPAFAELLLRKVEIETDLEDLREEYTDDHPKVRELRFQLEIAKILIDRILAVNPAEAEKLSSALGKMLVRKIELEANFRGLMKQYNEQHPEVKKAKRKLTAFDKAINEILP